MIENIRRCRPELAKRTVLRRVSNAPSRINMVLLLSRVSRMAVTTSSTIEIILLIFSQITATVNWTWVFIGVVKLLNGGTKNSVMDTSSKWIPQKESALLSTITCKVITLTLPFISILLTRKK